VNVSFHLNAGCRPPTAAPSSARDRQHQSCFLVKTSF